MPDNIDEVLFCFDGEGYVWPFDCVEDCDDGQGIYFYDEGGDIVDSETLRRYMVANCGKTGRSKS